MSSVPAPKAPPTKPKKDRERERERKEKPPPASERLKTVVRRLPPNLPEDVFWQSVDAWVSEETVTWKVFHPGKFRKRLNKENIPSRAYIAFKTEDQLALFSKVYDGHMFRDKAGNESHAVVEFAPYQKVPTEKRKPDARNATIEKDEDYISFLEALNASSNTEPVSIETLIAASQPPAPPKTTPLLEALKAEKSANKDKEAILRNHAHYKDQINVGSSASRKDDAKKKGLPAQKPAEPASSNKKPHKKGTPAPAPAPAVPKIPPIATAPKSAGGTSHVPPKSPKAARAPKPPFQPKVATTGPKVPAVAGTSAPNTEATTAPPGQATPATAAPPRRARPVIGLASRQFEAALSGVGVGASGERKTRREKEREKEQEKNSAGGAPVAGPAEIKPTPPSPRRERGRGRVDAAAPPGAGPTVKIPSILQRTDNGPPATASKDVPRIDGADATTLIGQNVSGSHHPGGGGRGARRGRGRGRGGTTGPARGG